MKKNEDESQNQGKPNNNQNTEKENEKVEKNLPKDDSSNSEISNLPKNNSSENEILKEDKKEEIKNGWVKVDDEYNYYENGVMAKSKWLWLKLENSKTYNWKYFDKEGKSINQFREENGKVWLSQAGPKADYHKGWWTDKTNGQKYYFRMSSGSRVDGWQYIEGAWRYFRTKGTMVDGWQKKKKKKKKKSKLS